MIGRCTLSTMLMVWSIGAHAIVNIESLRAGTQPQGFSGSMNLSVDGESGNTDKLGANIGARWQWHGGAITNFIILRYSYGQTSGVEDTNKFLTHARHIRQVTARTAYEGFVQAQRNTFNRLSFRGLIGGGVRLKLSETPDTESLHLGLGGFWSRETLEERAGLTDGGSENIWRFSTYINYVQRLNDNMRMLSTTYIQPAVDDLSDYRLAEEATLSVKMNDTLSLNVSLNINHDSKPPQAVKKTDTTYSTGLEYSF